MRAPPYIYYVKYVGNRVVKGQRKRPFPLKQRPCTTRRACSLFRMGQQKRRRRLCKRSIRVGPTLGVGERQVTMLFSRLNAADRAQFTAQWKAPVDLLTNHGGTLGGTLGYPSFQQNVAARGIQVFTSDQTPVKVSNTSTLHVSIPELQGLVSHDGARADVAKTIAVLTRGEFGDETVDGTQTHVAPHQNWLDINNASPLALNQLSVQLRDDSGTIVQDLDPETSLTIKFQQDPVFKQQEHTDRMLQAMQRQQQGQPMMEVQNVGS